MQKYGYFFKGMVIFGTILTWIPIITPILLSIVSLVMSGVFRFDYLMPAELSLSALAGGIILVVYSIRAKIYNRLLTWSFTVAVICLFGSQVIASATGLANGEVEPTPLLMSLVIIPLAVYSILLIVIGSGGYLLARKIVNGGQPLTGSVG
ncbi:MAG: hypothetical protein WCP19_06440 [Chloroflexota bacterium]